MVKITIFGSDSGSIWFRQAICLVQTEDPFWLRHGICLDHSGDLFGSKGSDFVETGDLFGSDSGSVWFRQRRCLVQKEDLFGSGLAQRLIGIYYGPLFEQS